MHEGIIVGQEVREQNNQVPLDCRLGLGRTERTHNSIANLKYIIDSNAANNLHAPTSLPTAPKIQVENWANASVHDAV